MTTNSKESKAIEVTFTVVVMAIFIAFLFVAFSNLDRLWKARAAAQEAMRSEASRQISECEAAGGSVSYVKTNALREMYPVRGADGNVACQQSK